MSKNLQRALLLLFVIVDAALIVGAVRHVNGTPPSTDLPEVAATSATPAPASGPSPTPTGDSAQVAYKFSASDAVTLSAANDGTVVFGTRGRCGDRPAEVSISTDGGADFSTARTGLTSTLAIKAAGAKDITVVGTDSDCDVQQVTSTNGGSDWTTSDEVDLWYPSADDTRSVVSPTGSSRPGDCLVTSLSQVTESSARVSCADGTFKGTGDDGKTWVVLGRLDNVRVGAFLTPSSGFALARYNGCGANQFATTDGGATWEPGGCITGDPAQAIAATSNGLTAVVAGEPYVSVDDGATWKQP